MNERRQFVLRLAPLAGAVVFPSIVQAQAVPALTETDSMAVQFGFPLAFLWLGERGRLRGPRRFRFRSTGRIYLQTW